MGIRTESSMTGRLVKHALMARAYEPTCVRLLGGGRIAHWAFRYDANVSSCCRACTWDRMVW